MSYKVEKLLVCSDYKIDTDGHIYGKFGKVLKTSIDKNGEILIRIRVGDDKIPYLVKDLVALHFVPNPNDCKRVRHKDGDQMNNSADNLEWC